VKSSSGRVWDGYGRGSWCLGLGSIPGVVEERLKVFRYLVQEKRSGTFGEVKFRESMG